MPTVCHCNLLHLLDLRTVFLLAAALSASTTLAGGHRLPLFRPPNSTESAAFAWSAHQPQDALLVVSDERSLALACLLDGGARDGDLLELSWTVRDEVAGAQTRHTLTASASTSRQTFSLDIGPGLQPAIGVFNQFAGSVLTVTFPVPSANPISVGCDLRLGGALAAHSARLRLWDERPVAAALAATESVGLTCRRARRQLAAASSPANAVAALTLDCAGPPMPLASALTVSQLSLLLETAVFGLHAVPASQPDCDQSASAGASPSLLTNATDASAFFAVFQQGRLLLGWTLEGPGVALDVGVGGRRLCVTADAAMPSGRRRLRLGWLVRVIADATDSNVTDVNSNNNLAFALANVQINETKTVNVDQFADPPVARALPCRHLCPAALADTADCKFAWLRAPLSANASSSSSSVVAFRPPDASIGWLAKPHTLILLPWQQPGNPGPPPLNGIWTCRSETAIVASPTSPQLSPRFLVRVTARPSMCGSGMPRRSVVFVPPGPNSHWAASQSLGINCTVCGLDSLAIADVADARLSLHGSLGGLEVTADQLSGSLPGGGLELGLRFTRFRLTGEGGGAALLRCRAVDRQGRGVVAYASVEALPAPPGAALDTDCGDSGDLSGAACRRFRCRLDPNLAAELPRLGVTVAFLFTLQPLGGEPPQQVLINSDRLATDDGIARLRCTQLLYYSDISDKDSDSGRSQRFLSADASTRAVYRAALGERRHSRLLLAVESSWLELMQMPLAGVRKPLQQNAYMNGYRQEEEKTDTTDIILGTVLVVCALVAIFFVLLHQCAPFRRLVLCQKEGDAKPAVPAAGTATTSGTATTTTSEDNAPVKKKKKKKKVEGEEQQSDEEGAPKKKKKKKKKVAEADEGSSADDDGEGAPKKKKKKKKKIVDDDDDFNAANSESSHNLTIFGRMQSLHQPPYPQHQAAPMMQLAVLSTTTTQQSPTQAPPTPPPPSVTSPTRLSPAHRDFGCGSSVTIGGASSPFVMSWDISAESTGSTTSATPPPATASTNRARFLRCSPTVVVNEDAATAPTAISNVFVVAEGSGAAVSAVASTRSGPSVQPALRIRMRDRPELRSEAAATAATGQISDAVSSDEVEMPSDDNHQRTATPTAVRAQGGRVAELARLGRCLTCRPPRVRSAPSVGIGIEMAEDDDQLTPSGENSADVEVDMPSSDPPESSTPVAAILSVDIAASPTRQRQPRSTPQSDCEDQEVLTGTGCCSDSSSSPIRSFRDGAEAELTEDSDIVRQAVRSALDRLTED